MRTIPLMGDPAGLGDRQDRPRHVRGVGEDEGLRVPADGGPDGAGIELSPDGAGKNRHFHLLLLQ